MAIDENEMLKLEGYDLERREVISAPVEFNSNLSDEKVELSMEFSQPVMKKKIEIHQVEHTKPGSTGSKTGGLF